MTSCSQLMDIEELVLRSGELDASHATALRAHAEECEECRHELAMVTRERALFSRRAEVLDVRNARSARNADALPPLLLPPAFARPSPRHARDAARLGSGVVRLLRRGHVSAACAAVLFVVAGFSRLGGTTTPVPSPSPIHADGELSSTGILASMRPEESLSCSTGSTASQRASVNDESSYASYASHASSFGSLGSLASLDRGLSCGGEEAAAATSCGSSVTCAPLRQ